MFSPFGIVLVWLKLVLDLKARQLAIRDYIRVVKAHFSKTLFAQYDAIVGTPAPAFCYGYTGNRELFSQADVITASGAPSSPAILLVLSKSSTVNSSSSESHNAPPKYTWVKDSYWWYYCSDGIKTGISIDKITELKITPYQPYHAVKLKEPSYRILFSPPSDDRVYDMVEYSSLKKAKMIAEWYYQEWLKVNNEAYKNGGISL